MPVAGRTRHYLYRICCASRSTAPWLVLRASTSGKLTDPPQRRNPNHGGQRRMDRCRRNQLEGRSMGWARLGQQRIARLFSRKRRLLRGKRPFGLEICLRKRCNFSDRCRKRRFRFTGIVQVRSVICGYRSCSVATMPVLALAEWDAMPK
jgi:hypothetical protein